MLGQGRHGLRQDEGRVATPQSHQSRQLLAFGLRLQLGVAAPRADFRVEDVLAGLLELGEVAGEAKLLGVFGRGLSG